MKKGRTTFSKEFKLDALELYKKAGPKAAAEAFGVEKSLLLEWRRKLGGQRFRSTSFPDKSSGKTLRDKKSRRQYSKEFKLDVLEFFKENGEKATALKFGINPNLFYAWSKAHSDGNLKASNSFLKAKDEGSEKEDVDSLKLLEKIEPFKNVSDDQKREVLTFYCDHGKEATLNKYGMTPHRLYNWINKFHHEFAGKLPAKRERKTRVEMEFRKEVLENAESFGIKAASEKYGVLIPTIWDWKSKTKMKAGKRKVITEENVKKEIVKYYLEKGAFSCEKKFQVPRQTVRNWAFKTGDLPRSSSLTQMKIDVVKDAKEAGVKRTLDKYAVSRATLYNWSKLPEVSSVTENQAEESIAVEVKKGDEVRRVVFFKKKPAVVKVPKEKISKKAKPKKVIVEEEPHNSSELPEWAKDFIKKNVPKVEDSVVLEEYEILFANDMFTLSTGNLSAEEEMLTYDVQNSALQDHMLDAVEVEVNQ